MIDLGVALTWAAISAASVKGLALLARAAATGEQEGEQTALAVDAAITLPGLRSIGAPIGTAQPQSMPSTILAGSSDASFRARARP
jgi:hypothetical protein